MTTILRHLRGSDHDADRRSDSLIDSESSFSRHSSIQGPYREGMPDDTSFPMYCTLKSQSRGPQVYNRSMLSLGHTGVYNVGGDINRPKYHIVKGAFLGDVGWLDEMGVFEYCFNIFHPSDHPIQYPKQTLPPDFRPFDTPLSTADVRKYPNYLPAGAILCTEGVRYSLSSASPLKAEFIANAREGAVLVLPDGATCEELLNPSAIHAYVKEHVVSWYQFFNGKSDTTSESPVANGTLLVVTSIVRAKSWGHATFPSQNNKTVQYAKNVRFKYDAEAIQYPWEQITKWHPINFRYEQAAEGEIGAVLLGGLSIALSPSLWLNNVAHVPHDSVQGCPVLLVLPMGLYGRLQRLIDYMKDAIEPPIIEKSQGHFHPSPIILQILLLTNPTASVGVVDDSIWVPHLNKRILTHPEFVGLIKRVFGACNVVITDGVVTLVPKESQSSPPLQKKRGLLSNYHFLFRISKKNPKPKSIVNQVIAKVLWLPE